MNKIIVIIIRIYQKLLSPLVGRNCRFHPSCSNYAIDAVNEYGSLKGSYFAVRRICRCNPFNEGGIDPVPRRNRD